MSVGIHINSNPNEILASVNDAYKHKAEIVQFFVYSNIKDKSVYTKLKNFLFEHKIKSVVHISYTINCSRAWDDYSPWIKQFIDEIKLADHVGAFACVVHLGKQLNLSVEESTNNMYTSLLYVHQQTKDIQVKILLETSTGQGTEIAYKLDDLAYIYRKFSKHKNKEIVNRFGICFDTCHVFSAGYDIRSKESREIFFDNFNELIGLDHIKLVHLNDSKVECGSNVDRHENLGEGYIGIKALKIIQILFKKLNIPLVLETPNRHIFDDLKLIKK
jgi:apurinic endonuclease APN1